MSRSRFTRLIVALLGAAAMVSGFAPAAAWAGEYRVYSCMTPSGLPAPTDGWTGNRGQSVYSQPLNYCGTGGPLIAELNPAHGQPANVGIVTWSWSAPPGATIAAYRIWRSAQVQGSGEPNSTPWVFSTRPANAATAPNMVDNCPAAYGCTGLGIPSPGLAAPNLLAEDLRQMGPVDQWHINAACGGTMGQFCVPNNILMSIARVHAAEFTLRDAEAPEVSEVAGRLTAASEHSGTEVVSFAASDGVSGVYRSFIELDGKVIKTVAADSNDGRCADAGVDGGTPYEFLYREPCRKTTRVDIALDTRTLSDGQHSLGVFVEDAAGNRTTVLTVPEFTVRNVGVPGVHAGPSATGSGTTAVVGAGGISHAPSVAALTCSASGALYARFAANSATRRTVRHGSKVTLRGRGPANADIDVFHVRGSKVRPLGSFRASSSGTFSDSFRARHGSGTIRLCGPGVAASLTLRVKAKVSLKVRLSRSGLVRYSGRVATGQIPKGGKIVVIQGKAGRSWQTFALRRTDRKGRFKGRYRLRVVIPGAKLKFRVRVPSEAGYPFVGVVGKAQTKRVR